MNTIEINSREELLSHLASTYGRTMIEAFIECIVNDNTSIMSVPAAIKFGCEEFYEGVILCDESENIIKLNLDKNIVINAIKWIYENDADFY
jgi:hypothetical protein